ncbi:hypothetical protein EON80_04930 [bacterium]|nr:MAG: hypothetical protein EON80_04930 [bacterium]
MSEIESTNPEPLRKREFLPGRILRSLWLVFFAAYVVGMVLCLCGDFARQQGWGRSQPQANKP